MAYIISRDDFHNFGENLVKKEFKRIGTKFTKSLTDQSFYIPNSDSANGGMKINSTTKGLFDSTDGRKVDVNIETMQSRRLGLDISEAQALQESLERKAQKLYSEDFENAKKSVNDKIKADLEIKQRNNRIDSMLNSVVNGKNETK